MEGTLALWFDTLEADGNAPQLELHVNLWRDLSADFNFLDVGFRLKRIENLLRFHLFFPVPLRLDSVSDLADTLRYGDTLKAVFNDLVTAGSGDTHFYPTELDGRPYVTVHRLDVQQDLDVEIVAMPSIDGTILTFGEALCKRLRGAGADAQYIRLRIHLAGRSRDIFSSEVAAGDWRMTTATSITETTEFRFNERRSYPALISHRVANGAFEIEKIHYFLIRDVEHQLSSQHRQLRNVRRLEAALWTPYLHGEPTRIGTWRAPSKVVRRLAIYHWSAKADAEDSVKSFTAFASFRAARVHLGIYAFAIILFGAMGSLVASILAARMQRSVPAGQILSDLFAAGWVTAIILAYWLLVAMPWRPVGAKLQAFFRHGLQWISSKLPLSHRS
jgi:hypothetical protein